MPAAALPPSLFTAPPSASSDTAPAASTGAATGSPGQSPFSRLLDPGQGSTASTAGQTDEASTGSEPGSDTATSDDAPWPPPGLETLIAVAVPTAPPAASSADPTGTDRLLRLSGGDDAATVPTLSLPAPTAATTTTTAAATTLAAGHPGMTTELPVLAENYDGDSLEQALARLQAGPQAAAGTAPAAAGEQAAFPLLSGLNAPAGVNPSPALAASPALLPGNAQLEGGHFDADVAQGVEYMLDNKLQSARIRISPQQLGMIEVELRLEGERVHASFSSAHADVRQALSESLPRLREMLDAQGLQMGQTAVGNPPSQQHAADTGGSGQPHGNGSDSRRGPGETADSPVGKPVWRHHRLLDTYA